MPVLSRAGRVSVPLVELALLLVTVVVEPVNVKFCTLPIWLKNGTTVRRTKRRSVETTACTVSDVPSESTVITGCWAAAKSPTTGITLVTNGVCEVSDTNACWPLNSVTLGACSTFAPIVACHRLDQEEGLDVAQDGKAERGGRGVDVQAGERRHLSRARSSLGWNMERWLEML